MHMPLFKPALKTTQKYEFLREPDFFYDARIAKDLKGVAIKSPARAVEKNAISVNRLISEANALSVEKHLSSVRKGMCVLRPSFTGALGGLLAALSSASGLAGYQEDSHALLGSVHEEGQPPVAPSILTPPTLDTQTVLQKLSPSELTKRKKRHVPKKIPFSNQVPVRYSKDEVKVAPIGNRRTLSRERAIWMLNHLHLYT